MSSFVDAAAKNQLKRELGHINLPEWDSFSLREFRSDLREQLACKINELELLDSPGSVERRVEVNVTSPESTLPVQIQDARFLNFSDPIFPVPWNYESEINALVQRELEAEGFTVEPKRTFINMKWSEATAKRLTEETRLRTSPVTRQTILKGILFALIPIALPLSLSFLTSASLFVAIAVILAFTSPIWASILFEVFSAVHDNKIKEIAEEIFVERASFNANISVNLKVSEIMKHKGKVESRVNELLADEVEVGALDVSREVEEEWAQMVRAHKVAV